jgi:hypothetical protein
LKPNGVEIVANQRKIAALAFSAAYLKQAQIDTAAGRFDLAEWCLAERKVYQRKLVNMREEESGE